MFDINKFDVGKFDSIIARGLSLGLGSQGSQVCIEAAVCEALNLPHGDDPKCVASSVRRFKIRLNDAAWSSPQARAKGLRDLGIAQLGSLGVVDDVQFATKLAEKTIRQLLPKLYRELWPNDAEVEAVAQQCEQEGTQKAARAAKAVVADKKYATDYTHADTANAANAAYDAYSATDDATTAAATVTADTAPTAASYAAYAYADAANAAKRDEYLVFGAQLALETLRELGSPGCELLSR